MKLDAHNLISATIYQLRLINEHHIAFAANITSAQFDSLSPIEQRSVEGDRLKNASFDLDLICSSVAEAITELEAVLKGGAGDEA